ncbi:hypothetical protein IWX90DRAFT_480276 [Phyllosticta citrichinensis]|uniref:Uncharacterized protein n=1 Tax=Phyllosticta citrichinensis TaxID=1130410 RepID=A0ABR1XLM3_9PEZI
MASSSDENIHFSGAYAVAEWHCTKSDASQHLVHPDPSCNVTFAVRLDVATNSASFKLRVPVALKAQRTKASVYLSIAPAHILSLSSNGDGPVPQVVRAKLNTHVTSLSFKLSKAPLVITPSISLTPKNKSSGDVLEMLQSLAQCTAFTIYIPSRYISKKKLDVLCRSVNDETILNAHLQDADLSSLYGGNGARTFDGGEFRFDAPTSVSLLENHPAESPPSYDELAPTPPRLLPQFVEKDSAVNAGTPSKRRRVEEANAPHMDEDRISEIFGTLFKRKESELRGQILAETQRSLASRLQELESRLTATLQSQMDARVQELREELRSEMDALGERLDLLPEEMLSEADDAVELKLGDRIMDIRDELRSYVTEELKDVEGRVKDDLSGASISLQFY